MRLIPIRSLLIFWLFLLSAIAFLDRTNVSIAGNAIRLELGIDNIRLGWIFSAFLIGYAAFQVVGGWLAWRFGPRRALTAGVLWWGLFSALTAIVSPRMAHVLPLLILIRFSLGAGEAVMYPASNQFTANWIPVQERGRANGWIFAGVGAGAGTTIPILTWLITHYGWRASFWFSAVVGVAVGLMWYVLARDTPEEHKLVSPQELAHIQAGRSIADKEQSTKARWWRHAMSWSVIAMTLSYFCYGYVAWIYFSWFFIYLAQARGLSVKSNSLLSMIPFIAMTVCCLAGGALSDWLARNWSRRVGRSVLAAVAFFGTAIFLMIGSHLSGATAASLVLAGGAGALYVSQSSYWSTTADLAGEWSGVVSGLMNSGGQIGGAVTASLTPWIASRFGWNSAFVAGAAFAAVGGLLWLTVDPGPGQEVSS